MKAPSGLVRPHQRLIHAVRTLQSLIVTMVGDLQQANVTAIQQWSTTVLPKLGTVRQDAIAWRRAVVSRAWAAGVPVPDWVRSLGNG